ncbi:response regulator [Desulfobotulus sp. H1]|uniref:histidine kinase n=1 Tax=Desulfobotulus pelophilus TaxID=2823377 RepID=A0ABT3N7D8_9BACT|nr:ATP-binding protein [Desulfobotulus pelophilus]MCW7753076.1 response regulator [Desulfobotulus pelophilus]
MSHLFLSVLLRRHLMWRLLLPAVLLVVLISLLLGWQRWLEIQKEQHLQAMAISEYVATYLKASMETVNLLAETASTPAFSPVTRRYLAHSDAFERILLLTDEGEVLESHPPLGPLKDYSRLLLARQQHGSPHAIHISSPYLAPLSDNITSGIFSYSVTNKLVVGELNLINLQDFISGLGQTEPGTILFITDRYGTLIAFPDRTLVDQQVNLGHLPPVAYGLQGRPEFLGIAAFQGDFYLMSAAPVLDGDWVVFTAWQARTQFFSILKPMVMLALLLISLLTITVWLLQQTLQKQVSTPIQTVARAMDTLERGNPLDHRLFSEMGHTPFYELQVLRKGFMDMAEAILQREKNLRVSEEKFRNLSDELPESIFEMGMKFELTYCNDKMLHQFGHSREEALSGMRLTDLAIAEESHLLFDYIWKIFRDEKPAPLSFTALCRNHGTFPAELHAAPVASGTSPGGLRGFIIDMTRTHQEQNLRMEMERNLFHRQKLESLGILAGGIAHDFNNILSAIQGNLELALLNEPNPVSVSKEHISLALTATLRAADLTRQMLAYSGKGKFMVLPVQLNDFLHQTMAILQTAIPKTVHTVFLPDASLPLISADPGQLQQVVMNLISNAAEAMPEGEGTLTIRTAVAFCDEECISRSRILKKPDPGHFVLLTVEDGGTGMDSESLQRLFDPFFTTKFTGRGLGLAAVLGIMQGHNGMIMVESRKGKGTVFRVYFPALLDENTHDATTPETALVSQNLSSSQNGIILVVDDEESVRSLFSDSLHFFGYESICAADGEQGLELFKNHQPHILCVILDLTMPGKDGIATLHAMRQINPDLKIILSSGYSEQEAVRNLQDKERVFFLKKPFSIHALQNILQDALTADPTDTSRNH